MYTSHPYINTINLITDTYNDKKYKGYVLINLSKKYLIDKKMTSSKTEAIFKWFVFIYFYR